MYGGLEGSAEGSLILSLTSQPLCEGFKINWPVGEARINAVCNLFSDHSRPLNLPRWPFKSGPRKQVMLFRVFQHILASVMSLLENAKRCVSVLNTAVAGAVALREKRVEERRLRQSARGLPTSWFNYKHFNYLRDGGM